MSKQNGFTNGDRTGLVVALSCILLWLFLSHVSVQNRLDALDEACGVEQVEG